jgi:hypothetical protein
MAKGNRLPRLKRAAVEDLPSFRLTERDKAIVQAVYEYRALTSPMIEALFFDSGQHTRSNKRLQQLFHRGFLYRAEQPTTSLEGSKPFIYFLDERGADLVVDLLDLLPDELDWKPDDNDVGNLFLPHLLDVNRVRLAVTLAARKNGWKLEQWLDERTLKRKHVRDYVEISGPQGGNHRVAIVPDAYFVLDLGQDRLARFFLEVDRRTETVRAARMETKHWRRKIMAYVAYYTPPARDQPSLYQKRYGEQAGLRILTVTTGARRLDNLAKNTREAGGNHRFWFTTLEQATPDQILTVPIWQVVGKTEVQVLVGVAEPEPD